MKKSIELLFVMGLSLTGCSSTGMYSRGIEDVEGDAIELIEQLDAEDNIESFSEYFLGTPQESIQALYDSMDLSDFGHTHSQLLYEDYQNDEYVVSVEKYYVTGQFPNNHRGNHSLVIGMKYENGQPYIYDNQDLYERAKAHLQEEDVYPEGFVEAKEQGRNCVMFDESNYMFMEDDVYEGCLSNEVKFAWQDADGTTNIAVLVQNGTDQDIYLKNGSITIESEGLGTILDGNVGAYEVILAGETELLIWSPDSVTSDPWGRVYSHININFE